MATGFCLVVSDIEVRNIDGGEHKDKERFVAVSLKGKKEKTRDSDRRESDRQDESKLQCTKWKESLEFDLSKEELQRGDIVKIKVFQTALIRDKLLGKAELPVEDLINRKAIKIPFEVNLHDGNNHPVESVFKCCLEHRCPSAANAATESPTSELVEEKQGVDVGLSSIPARTHFVEEIQKKIPFPQKPRDFQIRVKVVEGRHISGHNVNPVVRVTVGGMKKQTRVQHTTNQPYYNQTFSFNFTTKFQELFEEQIKFEVFDSRRLRHDSLIGFYKCDVREIYNVEGHIVLRKWIVLSEPQHNEKVIQGENVTIKHRPAHGVGVNAVGFLKVSMVVLEAGMPAPSLENLVGSNDEDDIESNLLHLPGISLSPAVFTLKVYKAEDIPQMDHDDIINRLRKKKKDRADPYCIFSFAGKKATSKIKYDSRSPKFNEQLSLSFKHPSVCDQLKIQLMDKDFGTSDDYIGTIYVPVSQISGQGGNEFLPTFGPCYLNMYGSPREYSDWPNKYEDLDKGIGEGAAYRGRVFVELVTKLDVNNEAEIEPIENVDIIRVEPYMQRKKFRLLAVFLEATMLAVEDAQVEFELSIGNYGNKLDDSVGPCPSSTPPTYPVFDGEKYYYVPWGNSKPYVGIDCQWEDIGFRLGALNKLLAICSNLEQNINNIKSTESNSDDERDCISQTLDTLITDCGSLPKLDPKEFKLTRLDLQMNETRREVLKSIVAECEELKSNLDDPDALQTIENFLKRIQTIAVEPQNSMPDVVIWMIKSESEERVAYCRIPANQLLYFDDETERGVQCGKTIDVNLKFPGKEDSSHKSKYAAVLRLMIWLGREQDQTEWTELSDAGGELSVYAETYENQTFYGQWSKKNLIRPSFSNANGTLSLPKDKFVAPQGWRFDGDWKVKTDISTQCDRDNGCKVFLEDVFENEYRLIPGGQWKKNTKKNDHETWTDRFGKAVLDSHNKAVESKDDIDVPKGWKWSWEKWIVDTDRAVDNEGWEYTMESSYGSMDYEAAERTFHFCRRRRWVRERENVDGVITNIAPKPRDKDGWEYALTFESKFHSQDKPLYIVRRKRLHKLLVRVDAKAGEPVFILKKKDDAKDEGTILVPPSIFCSFKDPIICQLRAYLFQGRNLLPSDPDGLADPYVRLSFSTRSATSKTIHKKLNPTWDQMLVLESVAIYGSPEQVVENPPDIVMELFDWDHVGKNEFLGRVQVEPVVCEADSDRSLPRLSWLGVYKGSSKCGDVLAAFELFLDEKNSAPPLPDPDSNGWFPIPRDIRPRTQRTAVEVLCWGLRNLRRYHWLTVKSPSIEIEIANEMEKKSVVENVNGNCDFAGNRVMCFDVHLPCEAVYLPAITIELKTNSSHSPIGICVVKNLHEYHTEERKHHLLPRPNNKGSLGSSSDSDGISVVVDRGSTTSQRADNRRTIVDWWTNYYAAKTAKEGVETYPKIYKRSLEEEFDHFQDYIKTFNFRRGKIESLDEDDEDNIVGEFKGAFAIYDLPDDFHGELCPREFSEQRLRRMQSVACLVRVYIVKVYDLKPKDRDGLSDPYLMVSLGDETFDNKESYESDTLEVEFGTVFEFHAVIPDVKDLKVKVVDYDYGNDDLIGETKVDLENRLLSRRHAIAGLPPTYNISGPKKWRLGSQYKPSKILTKYCNDFGIDACFSNSNTVLTLKCGRESQIYRLSDYENTKPDVHAGENMERLSLHVLHHFEGDQKIVPEHIETRDLMNKLYPNFSQGKLEMFVDIFPESIVGKPGPPLDITPRKPKHYELRVIVWNTKDVQLQETNIYGDEMSDIFVKCRVTGIDDVQKTDTHFRSLNGDGMFNYRMVFPFEYSPTKSKIIVMKKAHFLSRRKYAEELNPQLVVEIWDNDLISFNDFIGDVKLDLQDLPKPYGKSKDITDWALPKETNSLFDKGRVRGWWPIAGKPKENEKDKDSQNEGKSENLVLTGKVELTLELLEEKEAKARPVGKGQSEPNQHPVLEKPQRPATSFLWILNPWKSFRYVVWSHFKWYFVGAIILLLIILLLALFIYSAPGYSVKKLFNT